MPTISVLVAVHNEEKFIDEAINSVLEQSLNNFELIVIDDGSFDHTWQKIEAHAAKDERVKAIRAGKIGKSAAYNMAFRLSSSNIITFFAGDDVLPNDSLANRIKPFNNFSLLKDKVAAFGHRKLVSELKKYDGLVIPKNPKKGSKAGGTIVFSRAMANHIFPIPEELPNEDTWAGLCIDFFADNLFVIEEVILHYRIHEGNARRKGLPFNETNDALHKRFTAYNLFLSLNAGKLTKSQIENISKKVKLEEYRYNGNSIRIIISRNIPFIEKFRAIFYSNKFLYKIKVLFDRLLMGH